MSAILRKILTGAGNAAQLTQLIHLSNRALPDAPDGLTDAQAAPAYEGKVDKQAVAVEIIDALKGQLQRGSPFNAEVIPAIVDAVFHAKNIGLDDRELILEHLVGVMSKLPPGPLQQAIEDFSIGLFYKNLPHPPTSFMPVKATMDQIKQGGVIPISPPTVGKSTAAFPSGIHALSVPQFDNRECNNGYYQLPTPNGHSPTASAYFTANDAQRNEGHNQDQNPGDKPPKVYSTQFRTPNGAGNNPHMPLLGAAGTPYARSVPAMRARNPASYPDANLVFDALLRRSPAPANDPSFQGQGHGTQHPSNISSMTFAFAALIIHTLFRTNRSNESLNMTSSYLDLSVLYGCNDAELDGVRRKDGTGRLWEDVWADARLAMMPPAVGALVVTFCRNHNFVAQKLLQINEGRTYVQPTRLPLPTSNVNPTSPFPPTTPQEKLLEQDEDIFGRARLINCAFFMNVILGDYLSAILGTFREASTWCLNPLEEIRKGGKTVVERAEGNAVSVEFNLLYRWHATLSPEDDKWLENALRRNLPPDHQQAIGSPNYDPHRDYTPEDFKNASMKAGAAQGTDPKRWTFGGIQRSENGSGSFSSADLARILHSATQTPACSYGARGIPAVMKPVEVMGIEQARRWGVCTLNEFRKFIGLKPYETFEEWNPTGDIAAVAKSLYGHIDNLELYVGMQAEESKKPGVGAGLCPGYTISRAILADAVCLTRGDRFLTTDLTPFNLTAWGFQDAARDTKNGSMGGAMCKLLFRTLPEYYPEGSVYAHFPFITPPEMEKNLREMDLHRSYHFNRPPVPTTSHRSHQLSVNSLNGVRQVLTNMSTFKTIYSPSMRSLTNGYGFFLCFDEQPAHMLSRRMVASALFGEGGTRMDGYVEYYKRMAREKIKEKSVGVGDGGRKRMVNIVRDVINIVPVHWICGELAGIPLKSKDAVHGVHTEQEVYQMIAVVFTFIFLNHDPVNAWALRENSNKVAQLLIGYIKARLDRISSAGRLSLRGLRDAITHFISQQVDNSDAFLGDLLSRKPADMTLDELSYNVFGLIVASVANYAHAATLVVNFYLEDDRKAEREHIQVLAMQNDSEADALLAGYTREALRLQPQAPGIFRVATQEVEIEEGNRLPKVKVFPGEKIFVSFAKANRDPAAFENPEKVDPTRPRRNYSTFGHGEHTCLGDVFTEKTIPALLRAIFGLRNVRRAPGESGKLNRFKHDIHGTETYLYISNKGTISPFPASMSILYDV